MTTLQDAKLTTLQTELAATGHVNDLEHDWLVALGATAGGALVDMWWEVFDAAAIPAGDWAGRSRAYIIAEVGAPPSEDQNEYWRHYWLNATLGPPPAPMPPQLPDVLHWFDFTDVSTLWQDAAGTIPIAAGTDVIRVDNKGSDPTPVIDAFPPGPIWNPGIINGLGAANNTAAGFPASLQETLWGGGSGVAGIEVFAVARQRALGTTFPGNLVHLSGGGGVFGVESDEISLPMDQWAGNLTGSPQPTGTGRPLNLGEWVWVNAGNTTGAGPNHFQASGSSLVTSAGIFTWPVPGSGTMTLAQLFMGDIAEVLVYDVGMSVAQRAAVAAYFAAKYGATFPIAPPLPVTGLTHHFDASDASTVWADAGGTIPAINGGPILRLDNKGTDPTPLLAAGAPTAPIYRTAILNGLNIADFDTALKTVFGVPAAGSAFVINGASIAAVLRLPAVGALAARLDILNWNGAPAPLGIAVEFDGTVPASEAFQLTVNGNSFAEPLATFPINTDWYLVYMVLDTGAMRFTYGSAGPENTGFNGVNGNVPPASLLEMKTDANLLQVAEWMIWDGTLTPAERATLISYANSKYGTLPHP